jgi:hypothetical protein
VSARKPFDDRALDAVLGAVAVGPPPSLSGQSDLDVAWDERAERIAERSRGDAASDRNDWTRAPELTPEPGEPSTPMAASASPSRLLSSNPGAATMSESDRPKPSMKRPSLKELAERVSKTPPPPSVSAPPPSLSAPAAKKAESAPPTSLPPTSLPPTSLPPTSLPPTSLPPIAAKSVDTPSKASASAPPSVSAPAAVATPPSSNVVPLSKSSEAKKEEGGKMGLWIALAGLAAAAALFFFLRTSEEKKPDPAAAAATAREEPKAEPKPEATAEATVAPEPEKKDDGALDLSDLASESATPSDTAAPAATGSLVADNSPPGTKPEKPVKVEMDGTLEDKMRETVGPVDKKDDAQPAAEENRPKNVPDQPPQGSVTSAIAKVMGAAKACVAGADDVSRATVTFGSSGAVQSVTVGGWASGKPAAGCIQAALKGASVGPFSKPTYSFPVTIRP